MNEDTANHMIVLDAEIEAIREQYRLKFHELQRKKKAYFEAFPDLTQQQRQAAEERYRKAYWVLLANQMAAISKPANEYRKLFTQRQTYEYAQVSHVVS